ncbi:hypothetical protein EAI_10376 [Harpegnathos saltator]|uniref:Uncharacterized protein n=1 Tax=Harpegnathos saltator TaxID=610380 RepID=E2B5R7_HARSA|nr:hypothetical protein EAI_10376 [Harpegnathos saltator]
MQQRRNVDRLLCSFIAVAILVCLFLSGFRFACASAGNPPIRVRVTVRRVTTSLIAVAPSDTEDPKLDWDLGSSRAAKKARWPASSSMRKRENQIALVA